MGTHDFDIIIVMIIALVSDEHVSSAHEISIRKGELVDIDKHMLSNSYTLATAYWEKSSCCS